MNNSLQEQIQGLNSKVEQLQQLVIQLSQQITVLTDQSFAFQNNDSKNNHSVSRHRISLDYRPTEAHKIDSLMLHKDVLVDEDDTLPFGILPDEQPLTADIQVNRLTAQVTAAYHRIAALEEQLMAQRGQL
jgi:TolA-binding protein